MKILQVITCCSLGGAQSVVACLANELSKSHEVVVAAGEGNTGEGTLWNMLVPAVKREPLSMLKRSLSFVNDTLALWQLRSLWRRYRPDVVHLHSSKAGILGRVVFPRSRIVYTVHGFDSIRLAYRRFLPIERLMQSRAAAIVGVSRYDVANLLAEGISKNVRRVNNGIPPLPHSVALPIWSVPRNYARYILCIARLSSPKRPDIFIDVARLLPCYAFVWIGNQKEVNRSDLPANVYFLGNILDARRYLPLADLLMLPSNYEGMPMVILEALSCGIPVVASDVGGVSEVVKNGETGYAVKNNPEDFAAAIQEILKPSVYAGYSSRAYAIYQREFTADKMVRGYLQIYEHITNQ